MAKAINQTRTIKPIEDSSFVSLIIKAVEDYDLASSPEWQELDELSSHTKLEAIEINPNGVFEGPPGFFQAVGSVYVTLNYGAKRDSSSMSDSYPVLVTGKLDRAAKAVSVETVTVDTSSFYK
jgi:Predicted pPIWI-associating nuclease